MKKTTFLIICNEFSIDPDIAMENDNVKDAVIFNDEQQLRQILKEEF
jgi:hypothetical protein